MNVKTVLIVDDSPCICRMLSMKLRANGYDALTAYDGASAVNAARVRRPDAILLDLNFPPDVAHGGGVPWDGILIMKWLQRVEEAKDIPVIIISGSDPSTGKERAMEAGAVSFFQKPVSPDELLATLRQVLARASASAAAQEAQPAALN